MIYDQARVLKEVMGFFYRSLYTEKDSKLGSSLDGQTFRGVVRQRDN